MLITYGVHKIPSHFLINPNSFVWNRSSICALVPANNGSCSSGRDCAPCGAACTERSKVNFFESEIIPRAATGNNLQRSHCQLNSAVGRNTHELRNLYKYKFRTNTNEIFAASSHFVTRMHIPIVYRSVIKIHRYLLSFRMYQKKLHSARMDTATTLYNLFYFMAIALATVLSLI